LDQVSGEQQAGFYQQTADYSSGSTVEGQQLQVDSQAFEQQGAGFAQNVQYQNVAQYGVNA